MSGRTTAGVVRRLFDRGLLEGGRCVAGTGGQLHNSCARYLHTSLQRTSLPTNLCSHSRRASRKDSLRSTPKPTNQLLPHSHASQSAAGNSVTSSVDCQLRYSSSLGAAQQADIAPASKTSDEDVKSMYNDVIQALSSTTNNALLQDIAGYYFDGQGKAVRPLITCLTARAVNAHTQPRPSHLMASQRQVAVITEMIHTASLVHDDVIDASDTRRGKPSVNKCWGQKRAIMAGDYILSVASTMLARIGNDDVTQVLSQVLADLVQGEFMQLGAKENETERFAHYLAKTFKKTASLIAYSCRAVAILGEADQEIQEVAYQYGRNVGMAFQLVDDLLDFISSSNLMGKPAAADLRLGLATAPVLFACEKYPELNPMIMRRFSEPGDVERAYKCVMASEGLQQTRILAESHCTEAIRQIRSLRPSEEQRSLISITDRVLNRMK